MEGHSLISADILASYAADAALEIEGVSRLVEGTRPRHHGVKITNADGVVAVELHLGVDWGVSIPAAGAAVQTRVAEYLERFPTLRDLLPARLGPLRRSASRPGFAAHWICPWSCSAWACCTSSTARARASATNRRAASNAPACM